MKRRGFSFIEQAMFTAIIIAALVSMAVYIKRAICGGWRKAIDVYSGERR